MDIRSTLTGFDRNVYLLAFISLFLFPLLPEYIGPILTVVLIACTLLCYAKNKQQIKFDKYGFLNGLFVLYLFVTVLFSKTPLSSLGFSILFLAMFLGQIAVTLLANTKKRLQFLLHALLFSAAICGLIGFLQFLTRNLYAKGIIPFAMNDTFYGEIDRIIYDFLGSMGLSIKYTTFMFRASGTFSNPNIFVGFLLMIFPIGTYYMLRAKKRGMKIIYIITVLFILAGVASSQSRSAIISIVLSVVFIVIGNRKYMRKLLIIFAGLVGVSSAVLFRMIQTIKEIKPFSGTIFGNPFTVYVHASTYTHLSLYNTAISFITSNIPVFLFGLGAGTETTYEFFKEYGLNQPHAHNIILQLWLESGLIGTTLFILAATSIFFDLKHILRISPESRYVSVVLMAAFVGFFSFCIFDYILFDPKIVQCYFILCGLASATIRLYSKKDIKKPQ